MLALIYGTNSSERMIARDRLVADAKRRAPSATLLLRSDIDATADELDTLAASASLFSDTLIVVFEHTLADAVFSAEVVSRLKNLAESANTFIFVERELAAPMRTLFSKHTKSVIACDLPKEKAERADVFAFTDAFSSRDRKRAWRLYREALDAGSSPEELAGLLFWATKNMFLAGGNGETPVSTGLHPFVFKKSQAFARNFSRTELAGLSKGLVDLYADGHRGGDMTAGLETLILTRL